MRSRTTAALLALALGALIALTGLGSPAGAHTTGGHRAPKTVSITIMGYAFSPASVTVNPGDTVVWTNTDTVKHDATSLSGPATFGGPLIGKGETYRWVATSSGDYAYYCSVHPEMKARLTVAAAPAPVATRAPVAVAAPTKAVTTTAAPRTAAPKPAAPSPARTTASPAAAAAVGSGAGSTGAVAPQPPVTQAVVPVSEPDDALDPTLLVVALAIGAAVFALLSLGPRAPRTVKVVMPPPVVDDATA